MKPEGPLVAERALAQHCPELLRRAPEPADLLPELARLGERFARGLIPALAPLCGDAELVATVRPPRDTTEADLGEAIGPLAANALFASGVPGVNLIASFEGKAVLQLVDCAFGGKGDAPERLPKAFPASADLMIARIEAMIADALAAALGRAAGDELAALRRDPAFAELGAWPAGARLAALDIEISEGLRAPWLLRLAVPVAMLPRLLGQGGAGKASPAPADPAAAPFADVPLPLTAVLVDMALPLATVSTLEVGSVLPVAVARAVPLCIAGHELARGTVGAQDDRVALKLVQIA